MQFSIVFDQTLAREFMGHQHRIVRLARRENPAQGKQYVRVVVGFVGNDGQHRAPGRLA